MKPSLGWLVLSLPLLLPAAPTPSGDEECAQCHQEQVAHFRKTPMAKALYSVRDSEILQQHPSLSFREGGFSWRIVRDGTNSVMTVTTTPGAANSQPETLTATLLWAFGRGQAGQTYIFEHNGGLYESRVSFYNAINGLDLTMGAQGNKPNGIEDAAGRRMDAIAARDCFGCHSTGAVLGGRLHLESIVPGVGCESCHVNAARHAAAMGNGNTAAVKIAKLGGYSAEEMGEICGTCHRTWSQIASSGPRGVLNVRFQPYRLANSKCYDASDPRISCTACHDPHGALETRSASYDAKCLACHSGQHTNPKNAQPIKTCRVAKSDCITCHMPKFDLPGAHARFTDHQIRIVRKGEAYPN